MTVRWIDERSMTKMKRRARWMAGGLALGTLCLGVLLGAGWWVHVSGGSGTVVQPVGSNPEPLVLTESELGLLASWCGIADDPTIAQATVLVQYDSANTVVGGRFILRGEAGTPPAGSRPVPRDRDVGQLLPGLKEMPWWDLGSIGPPDHAYRVDGPSGDNLVVVARPIDGGTKQYCVRDLRSSSMPPRMLARLKGFPMQHWAPVPGGPELFLGTWPGQITGADGQHDARGSGNGETDR